MMIVLVIISYLLSAFIFVFYGHYYKFVNLFERWLIYPILAILIEMPNMLVIYIIHWQSYKPLKQTDYKVSGPAETTDQATSQIDPTEDDQDPY
jgi:uncharacterized membrane protein